MRFSPGPRVIDCRQTGLVGSPSDGEFRPNHIARTHNSSNLLHLHLLTFPSHPPFSSPVASSLSVSVVLNKSQLDNHSPSTGSGGIFRRKAKTNNPTIVTHFPWTLIP